MNLFTRMVREATTGRQLSLYTARRYANGQTYRYLNVHGELGGVGGLTSVQYEIFEALVLDGLDMLRPADVLDPADRADERETRIATLTARVTALAHRQEQLQQATADPEQDAAVILPALARVSADLKASALERDRLQLETHSGRAEALTEAQTLHQLRGKAEGEERAELDRRIKAALPSVVSEIWVQAQKVSDRRKIFHVQIYLRGGTRRYLQLLPMKDCSVRPWQLEGFDLRRGPYREVGDAAADAQPA